MARVRASKEDGMLKTHDDPLRFFKDNSIVSSDSVLTYTLVDSEFASGMKKGFSFFRIWFCRVLY